MSENAGMTFTSWLESTRRLQTYLTDTDPSQLEGEALNQYVKDMTLSAQVELAEFLQSTYWKPWGRHDGASKFGRDETIEELVDVLHFVANLLVAMRVDGDHLTDVYQAKQLVNRARRAAFLAGHRT